MNKQEISYTHLFLDSIQEQEGLAHRLNANWMNHFMSLRRFLEDHGATQEDLINLMDRNPFDTTQRGSIQAKVKKTWAKGCPDRDYGFQICLLMEWDVETSVAFMNKVCAEPWIHWRNEKEVIYDYCIRHRKGIGKAHSLIEEYRCKLRIFADERQMDIKDRYDALVESCKMASSETPLMKLERLVVLMETDLVPNFYLAIEGNSIQTTKAGIPKGHVDKSDSVQEQARSAEPVLIHETELAKMVMDGKVDESSRGETAGKLDERVALFLNGSPFVRTLGTVQEQESVNKAKKEICTGRERFYQFCLYHKIKVEKIVEAIGNEQWSTMTGSLSAELFVLRFCVEQGIDSLMAYHTCNRIGRLLRNADPGYTSLGKTLFGGVAADDGATSEEKAEAQFKELLDRHLHIFSERRQTVLKAFRKLLDEAPHHVRYYMNDNMPPNFTCYENEEGAQIVQPSKGWLRYFPVEHLLELLQMMDEKDDTGRRKAEDPERSRATRMRQWYHGYETRHLPDRKEFILCMLLIGMDSIASVDCCLHDCGYAPLYARRHLDYVILNLLKRSQPKRSDYQSFARLFWELWDGFKSNKDQYLVERQVREAFEQYAKTLSNPSSRWKEMNTGGTAAKKCLKKCMLAYGVKKESKRKAGHGMTKEPVGKALHGMTKEPVGKALHGMTKEPEGKALHDMRRKTKLISGNSMDSIYESKAKPIIQDFREALFTCYAGNGEPAPEVARELIDKAWKEMNHVMSMLRS